MKMKRGEINQEWAKVDNTSKTVCDIDGLQLYQAPHNGLYCDREHEHLEVVGQQLKEDILNKN